MLDYQHWLEHYMKTYRAKKLTELEQIFRTIDAQLIAEQQYANVCHFYYTQAATYFAYGQTLKALRVLLTHREFINQHAQQAELLRIRLATVVILDAVGYTDGYIETLVELHEQAVCMDMKMLTMDTLNNMGDFYLRANDFEKARQYLSDCMEYGEQKAHREQKQPFNSYFWALLNLMELALKEQRFEQIPTYIKKFEAYTTQDPIHLCNFNERLMRLALAQGHKARAKEHADLLAAERLETMEYQVLKVMEHIVETYVTLDCLAEAVAMQERLILLTNKLTSHAITQALVSCRYDLYKANALEAIYIDSLTNAWNRAGFEKTVMPLLLTKKRGLYHFFAVLDVDYFKQINDAYGHLVGDEVLKELTRRAHSLYLNKEASSYYFGRYGGDEFYVYYQGISEKDVRVFATHFYEALTAKDFIYEQITIPLSVSMGAVYAEVQDKSYAQWFDEADALLYDVKRETRGQLRYKKI